MKEMESRSSSSERALPAQKGRDYSEDGVDLTLIRWMLSLTLSERLQVLQQNIQFLARLCNEGSLT